MLGSIQHGFLNLKQNKKQKNYIYFTWIYSRVCMTETRGRECSVIVHPHCESVFTAQTASSSETVSSNVLTIKKQHCHISNEISHKLTSFLSVFCGGK